MTTDNAGFMLTENAAARVQALIAADGNPAKILRITVSGGGCSGFQYGFALDDQRQEEDVVIRQHGVDVVIDAMSLELLSGSVLDFVEELVGASFRITNPNASSTCGCGNSFAL